MNSFKDMNVEEHFSNTRILMFVMSDVIKFYTTKKLKSNIFSESF